MRFIDSDRSRVTSPTVSRSSSGMTFRAFMTVSDLTPLTMATRHLSLPWRSRLVTTVYSSPFEREVSSMARRGPMLSGNTSHSSAWSSSAHVRKPLSTSLYCLSNVFALMW